jgi:hypothetical protein
MSIKKTAYYILLILVLFSVFKIASANLEITEINNPKTPAINRWIKIYNNDSVNEVNLTGWYVRDDHGGTWHYHTIKADGSLTLAPNSYATIADSTDIEAFKTKNSDILGIPLFYGSLTFEPEGIVGTMGLSKGSGKDAIIIGKMTYDGNNKSSSVNSSDNSLDNNTDNPVDETIDTTSLIKEDPLILKTTTKIISPKVVVAGIPFSISSQTTTNKGETFNVGKFVWNFGDGMANKVGNSEQFEYIYRYPGEYILTLSYFDNSFSKIPTATDRITMKVIPSDIYVSSVGNNADPFIEIGNKSSYEIILSNWVVTAGSHYFTIPEGTTLLPGKKIKLAPKITGFVGEDLNFITISNPSGETIATYPVQIKKVVQNRVLSTSSSTAYSNSIPLDNPQDVPLPEDSQVINLNDLGSSTESSGVSTPNSAAYPFVGLGVVVTIGIMSFLLIRKKREVKDYVEVGLSAKDMTIIE